MPHSAPPHSVSDLYDPPDSLDSSSNETEAGKIAGPIPIPDDPNLSPSEIILWYELWRFGRPLSGGGDSRAPEGGTPDFGPGTQPVPPVPQGYERCSDDLRSFERVQLPPSGWVHWTSGLYEYRGFVIAYLNWPLLAQGNCVPGGEMHIAASVTYDQQKRFGWTVGLKGTASIQLSTSVQQDVSTQTTYRHDEGCCEMEYPPGSGEYIQNCVAFVYQGVWDATLIYEWRRRWPVGPWSEPRARRLSYRTARFVLVEWCDECYCLVQSALPVDEETDQGLREATPQAGGQ